MRKSIILLPLLLSACVQDGSYLGGVVKVEGFSKPNQAQPKEHSEASEINSAPTKNLYASTSFEVATELDVDSSYVRLKREFGFRSKEEVLREPAGQWALLDESFRYEAIPGVSYHMKTQIKTTELKNTQYHNLEMFIEKDAAKTKIISKIWISEKDSDQLNSYANDLKSKVLATLRK